MAGLLLAGSVAQASVRYSFIPQKLTWSDALTFCSSHGGTFAKVTNADEQAALVAATGGKDVWIGGTDRLEEGEWNWMAGGSFPNGLVESLPPASVLQFDYAYENVCRCNLNRELPCGATELPLNAEPRN